MVSSKKNNPFIKLDVIDQHPFDYKKKYAVVITVSDYSNLRSILGSVRFLDLEETKEDHKVAMLGLERLGFSKENITEL